MAWLIWPAVLWLWSWVRRGMLKRRSGPKRLGDLSIRPFPGAAEALTAVADGEVDAALVDSISGRLYLAEQTEPALKRLPEPVTVEPFALVTRIEDETLLDRLNGSLAGMSADGRLEQIIGHWLGD